MTTGLSAGIYSSEEEAKIRQIQGVPTSVIGVVGITERGEVGKAKNHTSWPSWVKEYGSYIQNSDLPQSVEMAFRNGAREIITVRTMHYSDITNALSKLGVKASGSVLNSGAGSANAKIYSRKKAPYSVSHGDTLILKRDGVAQPTLTFSGTRASVSSGNSETRDMSGGKTLIVAIDNGQSQTITFVDGDFVVPTAATAEEVASVINAQLIGGYAEDDGTGKVLIASDTLGSNSAVIISASSAQTLWNWPLTTNGTGNVANLAAVTIAEIKALLEALVTNITVQDDGSGRILITHTLAGSTKTLQIDAASTADDEIFFDNNVHAGLDSLGGNASKTSTLAGPWYLANGDTLNITTDLGGPTTATFTGVKAAVESTAETWNFTGGKTLTVKIQGKAVQTITFVNGDFAVPGAATAEEIVEAANKQIIGGRFKVSSGGTKVTFESDIGGTSSLVEVTGGTAQVLLAFPSVGIGSGNVANIAAVTAEEAKAIIEEAVTGVRVTESSLNRLVISRADAGVGKTVQVPSGTASTKFAFDAAVANGTTGTPVNVLTLFGKTEGTYANSLVGRISNAASGNSSEFDLRIIKGNTVLEFFLNVTMGAYSGSSLPSDTRYAPLVVNDSSIGSNLLSIEDELAIGTALQRRPANGDYLLTGGDDGLTGLVDNDFIGDEVGQNGMRAFDDNNEISLLSIPGRATSAVHNAMITYCDVTRRGNIFPVLDPPTGMDEDQIITYVTSTAGLKDSSEYGAIYYPELKILNPNKAVFGNVETINIPPSGPVLGMFARKDDLQPGGVYLQPANITLGVLRGVLGTVNVKTKDEKVRDKLYPQNINPIWMDRGVPCHVDGCANLKRTGNFQSIGERRGVIFIKRSLESGLSFAKHINNTADNRKKVERSVNAFLLQQMKLDAFASKDPTKAFSVDMGPAINPPSEQLARRMNIRIGLATAKPAEFVNLIFSQDQRLILEEVQQELT